MYICLLQDPSLFASERVDVLEMLANADRAEMARAHLAHNAMLGRLKEPMEGGDGFGASGGDGFSAGDREDGFVASVGARGSVREPAVSSGAGGGAAGKLPDEHELLDGPHPSHAGHAEQQPDAWVYKDPQGVVQGPFVKQDIMEW